MQLTDRGSVQQRRRRRRRRQWCVISRSWIVEERGFPWTGATNRTREASNGGAQERKQKELTSEPQRVRGAVLIMPSVSTNCPRNHHHDQGELVGNQSRFSTGLGRWYGLLRSPTIDRSASRIIDHHTSDEASGISSPVNNTFLASMRPLGIDRMVTRRHLSRPTILIILLVLCGFIHADIVNYDDDYLDVTIREEIPYQRSTVDSDSYVVAVVEFHPEQMTIPIEERTRIHLNEYSEMIRSATARPADIIVFPELTLNSLSDPVFVPEPSQHVIPCNDYGTILVTLSCLAREVQKYLVINLSEQFFVQHRAETVRYNTDVVFDRNGMVIARYRKFNLFKEPGTSITDAPELVTFDTDFGVRFGVFTCFDILFAAPTLQLVKQGLRDFVFPAFWTSEPPFLASTQIFESWAYAVDANLIVSGTNYALSGATGTGVFNGRSGALLAHFTGIPTRQLHMVTVPKKHTRWQPSRSDFVPAVLNNERPEPHRIPGAELERVVMGRDFLEQFTTMQLNPEWAEDTIEQIVCHGFFCCDFSISTKIIEPYTLTHYYRMAVFDGDRTFQGFADAHVSICAVIACRNESIASCGRLLIDASPYMEFTDITITGRFIANGTLAMPNTLDMAMYSLDAEQYQFSGDVNYTDNYQTVTMKLNSPVNHLQTFGIYAFNHKNFEFYNPIELPAENPPPDGGDDGGDDGAASLVNPPKRVILLLGALLASAVLHPVTLH
ncbi:vanin-like protein 2 isoform X2 [Anopheles darlingi]|nr:vanin-like protein 2 isoform X2 [Anopheles darlingi]XP_049545834.1 vanin-like protein 2 isoform X2 [Anopheles darlingi]